MERGELVRDETVLALVAERTRCLHCGGGFMLDGFPRTRAQAIALDELMARHEIHLDAGADPARILASVLPDGRGASLPAIPAPTTRKSTFAAVSGTPHAAAEVRPDEVRGGVARQVGVVVGRRDLAQVHPRPVELEIGRAHV